MSTSNATLCNNITSAVRAWVDDDSEDGNTFRAMIDAIERAEAHGIAGQVIRAAIDRGASSRNRDDVHRAIGAIGYDYVCNVGTVRS